MKTIAVDFDGTITKYSPFPITGNIRPEMKQLLAQLHNDGYRLVLYTCRKKKYYSEAVSLLKKENMYNLFDWEYLDNDNVYGEHGKMVADLYLDDKALLLNFDDVDWNWLYTKIVQTI